MKDEAPESLIMSERTEPNYAFDDSCMKEYQRRVIGFPGRSDSPIKCIPCRGTFTNCVLKHFRHSNSTLVSLYLEFSNVFNNILL